MIGEQDYYIPYILFCQEVFFSTMFERVRTTLGITVKHIEIVTLPRILDIGRKNVYTLLNSNFLAAQIYDILLGGSDEWMK